MSEFLRDENGSSAKHVSKKEELHESFKSLSPLSIKKASLAFRAINHKLRQEMISMILNNGKASVTEIFVQLRVEQSVASQHLAILRRAGIVETERDGKFMYYKINETKLKLMDQMISELLS
ncbi:MAG: ArsR/SmtB family transcription factor [bacterium]|jgi:DNA-binding transcriptional ArsR family regulator